MNLAACIAFAALGASGLHAATITVVNTLDSGIGSLRDAVASANAGDAIDFVPALAGGTIVLISGEILIDKNLTITGLGASALAVSGNQTSRVLNVTSGTVSISGLTIKDGLSNTVGGGIYNGGTLAVSQTVVRENTALLLIPGSLCGGVGLDGAGIYNAGDLMLSDSTVSGNNNAGIFCGAGSGAGIYNGSGNLAITKSTVSGNVGGAGIFNNTGTLALSNSTVSGNGIGGGVFSYGSFVPANNTITNNSAFGIFSAAAAVGNNNIISGINGADIAAGTTIDGVDNILGHTSSLFLGPLADNGGPTLTHALLPECAR